jgi:hypothetical protein
MTTMLELKVSMDFACCTCHHTVGVTLECKGKGLIGGLRTVAAVNVPCPTCGQIIELYFEPSGRIHSVAPHSGSGSRAVPEPSMN